MSAPINCMEQVPYSAFPGKTAPPISSACLLLVKKKCVVFHAFPDQELMSERMWTCGDKTDSWARRTGIKLNNKSAIWESQNP